MFLKAHNNLQKWYKEHGRHSLPWRQTDDPYKIYISEIMLQQTQVATVLDRFYFPFLEAFPTLESLANAHLDEVLKRWEGLGYYRRARNLHEAAQSVTPTMPKDVEDLIAMKGVGRSTAHAIASFAYKTPVPILDANVKRILYRIFAKTEASEKVLWRMAEDFFDARFPYEFNQALMDIGATICTKDPMCQLCPLESVCLASDLNPMDYPKKKKKSAVPVRQTNMLIYKDGSRFGLQQRTGEFLHGLWGFVQSDDLPKDAKLFGEVVQKYSHFHQYANVYSVLGNKKDLVWIEEDVLDGLALSGIDHKALELYYSKK